MKHLKLFLLLGLCISFTAVVSAQQKMLTVEEAVAAALENNYDILLRKNDSAVYALNNQYARGLFYPRFNASNTFVINHNNQKQRLPDGTERGASGIRSNNENAAVNMNWTVFDGLKMFATRDRIAAEAVLGDLNLKAQLNTTVADVINTYYAIVRQKEQLKAIKEQMRINETRVEQAEKKFSTGLGAKPELLQAKLDLNAQLSSLLNQQTVIDLLKEDLNLLISFAPGTDYEVADSIPINLNLSFDDIYSGAAKSNPSVAVARQQQLIAGYALKERKAERFPTININGAYVFSKTNNQTVVNNFTPLFNRNMGYNYGVSAVIPIFNGFTVRRQIKEAALNVNYQDLQYRFEQSKVNAAITGAFKSYTLQKKNLALEEENIRLAKENVYIAVERFRLGVSTLIELRETQKSLEDAYNRLISARYNTKLAETTLLRLKGELVK
jgi:outer membrane protein TolC